MVAEKEAPPSNFGVAGMEGMGGSGSGVMGGIFGDTGGPKVKAAPPKKVNISAGVAVGMLIQKTQPVYPPIAKAARVSGTVVLQATISKQGNDRRFARGQRTGDAAAGGPGRRQDLALQALPAQQ